MQLETPVFKTARERSVVIKRIIDALTLCETSEDIQVLWGEYRAEIKLIKLSDEQNERWYGEGSIGNMPMYPIVVEIFNNRKEQINVCTAK